MGRKKRNGGLTAHYDDAPGDRSVEQTAETARAGRPVPDISDSDDTRDTVKEAPQPDIAAAQMVRGDTWSHLHGPHSSRSGRLVLDLIFQRVTHRGGIGPPSREQLRHPRNVPDSFGGTGGGRVKHS